MPDTTDPHASPYSSAPRVALYCRISDDQNGLALGVGRQEEDARVVAALRKWPVAYVAVDNDISAFKSTRRPEFERVVADLEAGLIDGIVAYDIDRLARRPGDLERIIDLYDRRPLAFATVQGEIDLSTPDGRTMARVLVAFANKASMDTSRRVTREHLARARAGGRTSGGRSFGYLANKVDPDPYEAALVQQAAADIIAGKGLRTICREWTEAGVVTTRDNPWQPQPLRLLLTSPRLVGYRIHQGDIARDVDGNLVMGSQKPLLDMTTWNALCAILIDPRKGRGRGNRGNRKYVLSGLLRCGLCFHRMHGNFHKGVGYHYYSCMRTECRRNLINGPKTDEWITAILLRHLTGLQFDRQLEDPWPKQGELEDLLLQLAEVQAKFVNREINGASAFPMIRALEERQADLIAAQREWLAHRSGGLESTDVIASWGAYGVDQRRRVAEQYLEAVMVSPSPALRARFDGDRLEPVWATGSAQSPDAARP